MASYARSYLSSLREDPAKKKLMNTLGAIVVSIFTITSGSFLVIDQGIIKKEISNDKTSDFHYYTGIANIVLGVLLALYLMYNIFFR